MTGARRSGAFCGTVLATLLLTASAQAERKWDKLGEQPRNVSEAIAPKHVRPQASVGPPIDPARPTFSLLGARSLLMGRHAAFLAAAGVADSEPLTRDALFAASGDVERMTEENFVDPDVDLGGAAGTAPLPEPAPAIEVAPQPESVPAAADPLDLELDEEFSEDFGEDFEEESVSGSGQQDPLEAINRPIFAANLFLDRWLLRPVTRVYIETVPEPGRDGLSNALQNLRTPVILLNDFFQGEMSRAGATFGRFFINSLLGLGGMIDVADALGLPGHEEDFGQTLGSYGVGGEPYLVLPLLGPTNPRDAAGKVADVIIDPLTYLTPESLSEIETGVGLVNDRASIIQETDTLEATSLDYYAAVRSFYYQNRNFEIANGRGEAQGVPGANGGLEQPLSEELDGEDFDVLEEDLKL